MTFASVDDALGAAASIPAAFVGDDVEAPISGPLAVRAGCRLLDQSTNGSYNSTDAGHVLQVRRDTATLPTASFIGLGKAWPADAPQSIRFLEQTL